MPENVRLVRRTVPMQDRPDMSPLAEDVFSLGRSLNAQQASTPPTLNDLLRCSACRSADLAVYFEAYKCMDCGAMNSVADVLATRDAIKAESAPRPDPLPLLEFSAMGKLSVVAFRIAKDLAEAAAIEVGAEPLPWEELTSVARERFRYLAERAIATLDPDKRVEAATEAMVDVVEWLNQPYSRTAPDGEEIARFAIGAFEQRLFEKVGQP